MGYWEIDKTFHLEYGHRVWSQQLEAEFCAIGDTQCACRHPHGHSGTVRFFLRGSELVRGMVTDFKHLGFMKNFIDDVLDHKFIIDKNDPALTRITQVKINESALTFTYLSQNSGELVGTLKPILLNQKLCGYQLDHSPFSPQIEVYEQELLEGFFIVEFIPTSENLAQFICQVAQAKMSDLGVFVAKVEWNETIKSRAVYIAQSELKA